MERDQENIEENRQRSLAEFEKVLGTLPYQISGRLFLGSGTLTEVRSRYFSFGPYFIDRKTTSYLLGKSREVERRLTATFTDGEGSEGKSSLMRTSFEINVDTADINVHQEYGGYGAPFNSQELSKGYPLYGIDTEESAKQWETLANFLQKWNKHLGDS